MYELSSPDFTELAKAMLQVQAEITPATKDSKNPFVGNSYASLNSVDLTPPEVLAGLNTVLDGSPLCISENGGELIFPNPMFRFVATANTNGSGDMTGLYQGTQRQNLAWLDRFMLVEMGYPEPDVEKHLLSKRFPSLPDEIRDHMVSYANEVRKLFIGEASTDNMTDTLEVTFSTRSLIRWADLIQKYQPLARQGIQPVSYALDRALAFRAGPEARTTLHELVQRHFPKPEKKTLSMKTPAKASSEMTGDDAISYLQKLKTTRKSSPFVYLEKRNYKSDGSGSKFWKARAGVDGLGLRYGPSGQTGAFKSFPLGECKNSDAKSELLSRATGKIREGYVLVVSKTEI